MYIQLSSLARFAFGDIPFSFSFRCNLSLSCSFFPVHSHVSGQNKPHKSIFTTFHKKFIFLTHIRMYSCIIFAIANIQPPPRKVVATARRPQQNVITGCARNAGYHHLTQLHTYLVHDYKSGVSSHVPEPDFPRFPRSREGRFQGCF